MFASCKNEESGMTKDGDIVLSNLAAEPRIGAVVLKWDNPSVDDYYYATVTFMDASGEEVKQKVSVYSVDSEKGEGHTAATIDGFSDTNTYEFTVTPYTSDGRYGDSQTVSCAPENSSMAYKYISETIETSPIVEGSVISWKNVYDVPVTVTITYKNLAGETKTITKKSSDDESVEIYPFVDKTSVTFTATDASGKNTSSPKVVEVTPEKGEIPHSRMAVTASSTSGSGDYSPSYLIDDNVSTAWRSKSESLPWVTFDLGEVHKVNWIEMVGDSNNTDMQPTSIMIYYSATPVDDISAATSLGTFEYNPELVYNHTFALGSGVNARYILVAFLGIKRVQITEFCAYYADAASHYADESAEELMPDPDDDATYYPETEYMTPNTANINNLAVTASNTEDPSEFTYETTGGDSWVSMSPLKKQAPGTVLVFHYKSTADLSCEFFWCKGGWGVGGPAGGVETSFKIKKTDEWKTFKMNMVNAWNKGWWSGAPGAVVRFDIGDGAGEKVVIRLMHWRAATDGE